MPVRIFVKSRGPTVTSVEYFDTDTQHTNTVDIPHNLLDAANVGLNGPQLSAWMDKVICDAVNQDNSIPDKATAVDIVS